MLLFGALAFRFNFFRGFAGAPTLLAGFDHWLQRILLAAAAVTLVFSCAWLDLEAVMMGNGWGDALNTQTLFAVLFRTVFGRAWIWHMAFAAGALVILLIRRDFQNRNRSALLLCVAAAVVASTAWAGHAVMNSGSAGRTQLLAQVIHLLAASAWLGSLPTLAYILYKAQRGQHSGWAAAARYILPRYSRAGYVAVSLILATGCVNSWFLVGSIRALVDTTYGHVLIAKVCLVALMVSVALVNRIGIMPGVMRFSESASAAHMPFKRLWKAVALEQLLALAILAVVGVLGTLPPATPI